MIHFAYDGSINGDWVFRYALHLARHSSERRLHVAHVHDGLVEPERFARRLAHLRAECAVAGVQTEVSETVAQRRDVAARLVELIPEGHDHTLVCGARRQDRELSYLAGTVAEDLLRAAHCHVIAIRVVQPGLLGAPRDFLLPVRSDIAAVTRSAPLLRLFAPHVERAWLLLVKVVGHLQFQHLTPEKASKLLRQGRREIAGVERRVRECLDLERLYLDTDVVVSDDAPKEIVIHANRHNCQLILMGASERSFPERILFGDPVEQVLRNAPCDVAVFRVAP